MVRRSPFSIDYECETCGKSTAVNMRTGLLNGHNRPETRDTCVASHTAVVEPDDTLVHTWPDSKSPDSVPSDCPVCGTHTRANRRTGLLYSHLLPQTTQSCPGAAQPALPPEGGEAPLLQHADQDKSVTPPTVEVRVADTARSVRTVRGGLPGLGRRGTDR
jgi:hypothetical protein